MRHQTCHARIYICNLRGCWLLWLCACVCVFVYVSVWVCEFVKSTWLYEIYATFVLTMLAFFYYQYSTTFCFLRPLYIYRGQVCIYRCIHTYTALPSPTPELFIDYQLCLSWKLSTYILHTVHCQFYIVHRSLYNLHSTL